MKIKLSCNLVLAAAVAVGFLAGNMARGQTQLAAPGASVALPANIVPGSPVAEVVKLVQVGVDPGVIKTYIANSASAFNLDADEIISLSDLGVPTDIVNAMIEHDKNFAGAVNATVTAVPPPAGVADDFVPAAPTEPVDVNYFNAALSPYGSWVEVDGYGRVWRPTTVIYDASWQPYCDRGRWVYSDCGWYWDSDYSWGVTFHYGRWFHHDRFGWCWWPDTTWAPSWVTWRQSDAYCGWAPLPPFSTYRPGEGFFYRGARVAVGFDFGLPATCFTFVPPGNFCDRRLRSFRPEPQRVTQIFQQTTIINNYNGHNTTIVNGGISVDRVRAATRRPLPVVAVGTLPNAARQGWRGDGFNQPVRRPGNPPAAGRAGFNSGGTQLRPSPVLRENQKSPAPNRTENINLSGHPAAAETPATRPGLRDRDFNNNRNSSPAVTPPANNNPAAGTTLNRTQPQRSTPAITPASRSSVQPATPVSDWRQNRSMPSYSAPPAAARQIITPVAPAASQRDQRMQQRQTPMSPAPESAPVQTPPHSSSQNPAPAAPGKNWPK